MTYLYDIADQQELDDARTAGLVRLRHAGLSDGFSRDLTLHAFSPAAAGVTSWSHTMLMIRGLVTASDTGEVLARSFPKFFNYGQAGAPQLSAETRVAASDKMDGSLGILISSERRLVTRGGFFSAPALHGTDVYRSRYAEAWEPPAGITPLFEIIYPDNRVVLHYDADDLFLLGGVVNATGEILGVGDPRLADWPGPRTQLFTEVATFDDAIRFPDRANAEGIVLRVLDGPDAGQLVKLKQKDYLELHRKVTNTTPDRLWLILAVHSMKKFMPEPKMWSSILRIGPADAQRALQLGDAWRTELTANVPDEWHAWANVVLDTLQERHDLFVSKVMAAVKDLEERTELSRGESFKYATDTYGPLGRLAFSYLNSSGEHALRALHGAAWRAVQPTGQEASVSFWQVPSGS